MSASHQIQIIRWQNTRMLLIRNSMNAIANPTCVSGKVQVTLVWNSNNEHSPSAEKLNALSYVSCQICLGFLCSESSDIGHIDTDRKLAVPTFVTPGLKFS